MRDKSHPLTVCRSTVKLCFLFHICFYCSLFFYPNSLFGFGWLTYCKDHSNEEKSVCITVCLLFLAVDTVRDEVNQPQILACHQTALFTSVLWLSHQCYLRAGFRQTSIDRTAMKKKTWASFRTIRWYSIALTCWRPDLL